jgi:hypothetical protein
VGFNVSLNFDIIKGDVDKLGGDSFTTAKEVTAPKEYSNVYVNMFKNISTGEIINEFSNKESYENLSKKDAGKLEKDGYIWVGSYYGEYKEKIDVKDGEYYYTKENTVVMNKNGTTTEMLINDFNAIK